MAQSLEEDSSGQNSAMNLESKMKKNPTSDAGSQRLSFTRKQVVIFFLFMFTTLIMLVILIIISWVHAMKHDYDPTTTTIISKRLVENDSETTTALNVLSLDSKENRTLPGKLKLVSRLEWFAQPPVEPANPLNVPVPYVIIHHTSTENCSSQAQCVFHMRFIQTFHIESRNWWDIGYNFLVGGDGEAYEGRGWKSEGAHTYGYNAKSIGIAFIGTFNSFKPPERQILACKRLIQKGLELGYIKKYYKLLAVRQLQTTQSPGAVLYEDIKTWDHWAKTP